MVEYDVMGNVAGVNSTAVALNPAEIDKVAKAAKARADFSNVDPRRLDKGDGGKEAIARTQELYSKAEEQNKKKENKEPKKKVTDPPTPASTAKPIDNLLHDYATYTYGISFHVIPVKKYNDIMMGKVQYSTGDNTVLIASGGRHNSDFSRNKHFTEDFYFDNLKMTTIVGMNSRTRNTNAIDINFTLIEPYGFTFINRLLKVAAQFGAKSWFQIPFMVQIDFFGNTDLGEIAHPIPNTTKRIPVKLIACKAKVSGKGAEYQIQAVPYNHTAYSESIASTPAVLKVQATKLQDFFSASGSAGDASRISEFQKVGAERQDQLNKELEAERKKSANSPRVAELENQKKGIAQDMSNTSFTVYSYAAAMNSYQTQLKNNKHITHPEQYRFVFTDPEIANSAIVFPKKTEVKSTPMVSVKSPGGISAIRAQSGLPVAGPDVNTEIFAINAGTNIIEVINQTMRASDYIRNQFADPSAEIPTDGDGQAAADTAKKPINWYKIVPVIKILEFDETLNRYSRSITYYISKYTYHNSKFRDAPKSMPTSYSKKYNYMYTGQNKDVIDFSIDFDTMFYTAITADKSKSQQVAVQKQKVETPVDAGNETTTHLKVQTPVTHPVTGQADMPNPASVDNKSVLVNDFAVASMSSSRGDMINVKLKIIGDPQLIKQDDLMYNPANGVSAAAGMVDPKSNSIVFDAGEVFALLVFRTPVDFDDETGLMKFESAETSVFSGLYKIITVENEFRQGTFVQVLDMIRLFDQPAYDTVVGSQIQNTERAKTPTTPAEQRKDKGKVPPTTPAAESVVDTAPKQTVKKPPEPPTPAKNPGGTITL